MQIIDTEHQRPFFPTTIDLAHQMLGRIPDGESAIGLSLHIISKDTDRLALACLTRAREEIEIVTVTRTGPLQEMVQILPIPRTAGENGNIAMIRSTRICLPFGGYIEVSRREFLFSNN